ncbi:MAG: DUF4159 domain-containing protein, partial [Gemmatimonadota bacterium]|nr:DUF4159 domain-containing protein [Gemmatimonadota bacterium]
MSTLTRPLFRAAVAAAVLLPLAGARETPRLTIARLQYDGGGDWYANPSSLPNLLAAIRARTAFQVENTEARVTI